MLASDSTDGIISGATEKLIESSFTTDLIIYQDYYLQCVPYKDKYSGLSWYLVVLLPATLQPDHLAPGSPLYAAVVAIASITIVVIAVAAATILLFWKSRMMQLTQPVFSFVVLLGCLLLCISCFVALGPNTKTSCATRAYLLNLSLTLAFSPLLVKCWKVYALFVRTWKVNVLYHGAQNKLISAPALAIAITIFLAIDVLVASLSLFVGGRGIAPYVTTLRTDNGAYAQLTYCGYHDNNAYFYAELSYKGLLIIAACYLVVIIRRVADAVAGTKVLMGIVYNTAFVTVVVLAVVRSITDIPQIIFCEAVGICFCVIVCCLLLTVPVLYRIVIIGDKEAAAEVIDEMFQARVQQSEVLKMHNLLLRAFLNHFA